MEAAAEEDSVAAEAVVDLEDEEEELEEAVVVAEDEVVEEVVVGERDGEKCTFSTILIKEKLKFLSSRLLLIAFIEKRIN